MDTFELSTTKIPQAQINSVANAIGTISLYVKGSSQEEKLAKARRIVRDVMINHKAGGIRRAQNEARYILQLEATGAIREFHAHERRKRAQTYDRPDTYQQVTDVPGINDNSKNIVQPDASTFQTRGECENKVIELNPGISEQAAGAACDPFFGATKNTGVNTRTVNLNGGKSTITTVMPSFGVKKQASNSNSKLPYWAYTIDAEIHEGNNSIKSASQIPDYYYGEHTDQILTRKANEKLIGHQEKLKSASKKDDRPYWVLL